MTNSIRLLMATVFLLVVITSVSCPAVQTESGNVSSRISLEDPVTHARTIDVALGSVFRMDVWTRDSPRPGIVDLHFVIVWDSKLLGFVSREIHDHGFGVLAETTSQNRYEVEFVSPFPHTPFINDASWVTFTFRCLGEGSSEIMIAYSHGYYGDYGHEPEFLPEHSTVDQRSRTSSTVGHAYSLDKIATLWPWLVICLIGGIAFVAAEFRNRRRAKR